MDRQQKQTGASNDPIEESLLEEGQTSQESIVTAAQEAFEEDQRDPNHPTRIKRDISDVKDPSHSVGSTRHDPGERDFNEKG